MKCDKTSFCVYDSGFRKEWEWALNIRSVIVFGRIRPVTDPDLAKKICRKLCYKFTDDESYIKHELKFSGPNVLCLKLIPEHITGKLEPVHIKIASKIIAKVRFPKYRTSSLS